MKQKINVVALVILLFALVGAAISLWDAHPVFAASASNVVTNPAPGQLIPISDFGVLLKDIVQIFLEFAGGVAVIFLLVGGYQYVTSRGNEEAMERAKKTITAAIIGIVIIIMAFAIIAIINTALTSAPTT